MTDKEILIAARALVARGWCQGAVARDARGVEVLAKSPEAVAWSTHGAVWAVAGPVSGFEALQRLTEALDFERPMVWSDEKGRTQADVLALYDRVIAAPERPTGAPRYGT